MKPLTSRVAVRLSFNASSVDMMPLFLAADKGYYARAGLDVSLKSHTTSSSAELPNVAHGDIDIIDITASPGLSNAVLQGFDLKVVSSLGVPKEGRLSDIWMNVQKDESNQIKELKDLKGKTIEAGAAGSVLDLVAGEAVKAAGLTAGTDVTIAYRAKTAPDLVTLARNKAADVIVIPEPLASSAEKEGLVTRWKTYGFGDVAPWFQPSLLLASGQFIQQHPDALKTFLDIFLLTSREINAANGTWTDELLGSTTKNLNQPAATITQQGAVPYFEPNGAVSLESIQKSEVVWEDKGLVKEKLDAQKVLNLQPLQSAIQDVGKA